MDHLNPTQRDLLALAAWLYYRVECAYGAGDEAGLSAQDADAQIVALCVELMERVADVRRKRCARAVTDAPDTAA